MGFSKSLKIQSDEAYLRILANMEAKGYALPLPGWSSANLDDLINMLDKDLLKKKGN